MKKQFGVYVITNTKNKKMYVGRSSNIEHEWAYLRKAIPGGITLKNMKEDFKYYGEKSFSFEILAKANTEKELNRILSEEAYSRNVWENGYNTEPMLNYLLIPEEKLAQDKLAFFNMVAKMQIGKYFFLDIAELLRFSTNDMLVILAEITEEEMKFFHKNIYLKNTSKDYKNYYIEVKDYRNHW